MVTLQKVGESLDQAKTLEALARPHEKDWRGDTCHKCRTNGHPRGFNSKTRLCWWCSFPR